MFAMNIETNIFKNNSHDTLSYLLLTNDICCGFVVDSTEERDRLLYNFFGTEQIDTNIF